jgi:hypothetical protein
VNVLAETVDGTFLVDLDEGSALPFEGGVAHPAEPVLNLPRLVAAAVVGATVVAVVDAKPPLMVSHDGGLTWRASGRGLPPGRAVAISGDDPDLVVFAARNRLYVSRDGGVFWTALPLELPELLGLAF